jgi:prepilin peptidase CpaA
MYIFLIILLFLATITDLVRHKIPNAISLGGIAAGFVCQGWFMGSEGLLNGFLGLLVGFALLIPLYALRAMAAGDVKLMAMVGTFVGPKVALICVASTLILGMVLALGYVAMSGKGLKLLRRYGLMAKTFFLTRKWIYIPPTPDDAGAMRFPYAMAIFAGTAFALWYSNVAVVNLEF